MNTKSQLSIKELYETDGYDANWSDESTYFCRGDLTTALRCLLKVDYGRVQIIGQPLKKHLEIRIDEPSSYEHAELLKSNRIDDSTLFLDGNQLMATYREGMNKRRGALDSTTFAYIALEFLQKKYQVTIEQTKDTMDVWGLRLVDPSKVVRSQQRGGYTQWDTVRQGWISSGMGLHCLRETIAYQNKVLIYDETNEKGGFDIWIPTHIFETMEQLDDYLNLHYGLRLVKRRQLELLFIIKYNNP